MIGAFLFRGVSFVEIRVFVYLEFMVELGRVGEGSRFESCYDREGFSVIGIYRGGLFSIVWVLLGTVF